MNAPACCALLANGPRAGLACGNEARQTRNGRPVCAHHRTRGELAPPRCHACGRVLAAGAWCPDHGAPPPPEPAAASPWGRAQLDMFARDLSQSNPHNQE